MAAISDEEYWAPGIEGNRIRRSYLCEAAARRKYLLNELSLPEGSLFGGVLFEGDNDSYPILRTTEMAPFSEELLPDKGYYLVQLDSIQGVEDEKGGKKEEKGTRTKPTISFVVFTWSEALHLIKARPLNPNLPAVNLGHVKERRRPAQIALHCILDFSVDYYCLAPRGLGVGLTCKEQLGGERELKVTTKTSKPKANDGSVPPNIGSMNAYGGEGPFKYFESRTCRICRFTEDHCYKISPVFLHELGIEVSHFNQNLFRGRAP